MNATPNAAPRGRILRRAAVAGAGESLMLAQHARGSGAVLFVARDAVHAAHLCDELAFFAPDIAARLLPDWDVLPYDSFAPSAETASRRVAALAGMAEGGVTIVSAAAALSLFPPPEFVLARAFDLQVGAKTDLGQLKEKLLRGGYGDVGRVGSPGEFASCGGQLDVFPPDCDAPFRLVMFDDEIEQIRIFDPQTQRSLRQTKRVRLLPASECDWSAEGMLRFREACLNKFGEEYGEGLEPGAPSLLPLFYEQPASLFDYLTPQHLLFADGEARRAAADFLSQARGREHIARVYESRAALPVGELFLSEKELQRKMREHGAVEFGKPLIKTMPPNAAVARGEENPYIPLARAAQKAAGRGHRVVVVMGGEGQKTAAAEAMARAKVYARAVGDFADAKEGEISVAAGLLRGGFVLAEEKLTVFAESDIHGAPPAVTKRGHGAADFQQADEIRPGDLVTHREHGVGICRGLKMKTLGGARGEFFELEYADEKILWLPVAQMHHLFRHHGGAALSVLGGAGWRRARKRAEKNARDTAARLLEISARRLAAGGKSTQTDEELLAKFAARFPYPETPDQTRAIRETLDDLRAAKPADRLIAADVGFGKTEIAMRAACFCALSGKQTAVLAPTTLLAEQHARNFADRFAGFPVTVGALNRLTDARRKERILREVAEGKVDIVIGTHALLQKSARYKNLGLVVIDEEHRFGVRQKEHFKSLRANVDMLSLSATPIPRTMAMAMDGLRDMSVVSTPPAGRLPIKTMVLPFSRAAVVEAVEREMLRGGQTYFVHNDIGGITSMAEQIKEWLPRADIAVAHGQMPAAQIENAMRVFLRREATVLLCTAIIESGLDIANVNTVVVNRADAMGVSRLHQLRGRVGRGMQQGYAYFLTPPEGAATESGKQRMEAVRECAELGGGFVLAMRDLEIRGAGEILGERQSGDIAGVGCAMYQKLVRAAAREIRGAPPEQMVAVDLGAPARLPEDYVHSPAERMRYYWRLGNCETQEAVGEVQEEWQDRFGKLPPAARTLAASHKLRLLAEANGASAVRIGRGGETLIDFADGETAALPAPESDFAPLARAESAWGFLAARGESGRV